MTKARSEQVDLDSTPFYHCYVRCVRRAFLCGDDHLTGESYDHRKQWIVSRLKFLSYVYAIDICAYAVMSNHYHVVLHVDKKRAEAWSDEEVVERWMQLYKGDYVVDKWLQDKEALSKPQLKVIQGIINEWRLRLYSLEWFMRGVNETIARMANAEENCKGRFWEGRYKSQALLDEAALLSCMAYVDLNPVRAAMAGSLETSDFTSIQQRIHEYGSRQKAISSNIKSANPNDAKDTATSAKQTATATKRYKQKAELEADIGTDKLPKAELMKFDGSSHTDINTALPFTLVDYFDLVDSTGRELRADKRGAISKNSARLLESLGLNPDHWLEYIEQFGLRYATGVGSVTKLASFAGHFQQRWVKGVSASSKFYQAHHPY